MRVASWTRTQESKCLSFPSRTISLVPTTAFELAQSHKLSLMVTFCPKWLSFLQETKNAKRQFRYSFRKWTFENSARAEQLRVFREAVHQVGNSDVLDECLPNLSEIELKV